MRPPLSAQRRRDVIVLAPMQEAVLTPPSPDTVPAAARLRTIFHLPIC